MHAFTGSMLSLKCVVRIVRNK